MSPAAGERKRKTERRRAAAGREGVFPIGPVRLPGRARLPAPRKENRVSQGARSGKGKPRSLGATLDFMRTLWALDHGLLTASEAMNRRYGVTGPQRLAIRIVGCFPGISAGELAAFLHLHPSTLTGVLRRLGQRGLVARGEDVRDGRRAVLTLTEKGRALDGTRPGTVEAKIGNALRTLRPGDVATAETVLGAVTRALSKK